MRRLGPLMFLLAFITDFFAVVTYIQAMGAVGADAWVPAFWGSVMAGTTLVFGAGWLTVLWGEPERATFITFLVALGAHLFALAGASFIASPVAVTGMLIMTGVADGVALFTAWRTTSLADSPSERPAG